MQLFAMDDDGTNAELIGHLNLAMALHPQVLLDGRIAFSSWEEHGLRDPRQFPLWVIGPDGRGADDPGGEDVQGGWAVSVTWKSDLPEKYRAL